MCPSDLEGARKQIAEADVEIARLASAIGGPLTDSLPAPRRSTQHRRHKNTVDFPVFGEAFRYYGVDLTAVDGIGSSTLLCLMSEVGTAEEFRRGFRSAEAFASWLGLCPDNRISGGRVLSAKTRKVGSRLATAMRLAAHGVAHSKSKLGEFCRRMKGRLGKAEGITATAHKLARILFAMIVGRQEYEEAKAFQVSRSSQANRLKRIQNEAAALGLQLVPPPIQQKSCEGSVARRVTKEAFCEMGVDERVGRFFRRESRPVSQWWTEEFRTPFFSMAAAPASRSLVAAPQTLGAV